MKQRAVLYLVLAAVLWSSGGLFIKALSIGPVAILGARSLVAFIFYGLYMRRIPRRPDRVTSDAAVISSNSMP